MKTVIDDEAGTVTQDAGGRSVTFPMMSKEGFMAASQAWLRCGWDAKYVYGFSWLGRPVIQLPDDLIRIQEVIYALKPDVVIETGVAHGGSLIFYASLLKLMGRGRVIGVDVEIRPHNRTAIEAHALSDLITLIEGDSVAPDIVAQVKDGIGQAGCTLILLDSNHSKSHVAAELAAYSDLVTEGSYIVVTDGIMQQVAGAPRTNPDWNWNNPLAAIDEFLAERSDFVLQEPSFPFNEGLVDERVTYWPRAFLKRVSRA